MARLEMNYEPTVLIDFNRLLERTKVSGCHEVPTTGIALYKHRAFDSKPITLSDARRVEPLIF